MTRLFHSRGNSSRDQANNGDSMNAAEKITWSSQTLGTKTSQQMGPFNLPAPFQFPCALQTDG
jgi:hypothetical protein